MAQPQEDRLLAAEKRLFQTSAGNLRLIIALLALVAIIAAFETPLYGILLWVTEMYRRGDIEKDWWKCLVYDANFIEHYIDSQDALKLVGALATSIFQAVLCALLAVVLVQRASIRIDWVSSAIVNSLFLGLNILLPNLTPSFLAPSGIQSSLVILAAYVKPDMFDRIPKPNRCHKAYNFAKLVIYVEYAAVFCTIACMALAIRLAIRRRLAIRALRHARILMTSEHNTEDNTIRSHLLERSDLRRSSTGVFVTSECGSSIGPLQEEFTTQQQQQQGGIIRNGPIATHNNRPSATTPPQPQTSDELDETMSVYGQYVSVIPLKIAIGGLLVGLILVVSYLVDTIALTQMAILAQHSAADLPKTLIPGLAAGNGGGDRLTSMTGAMAMIKDRLQNGFVLYVSAKSGFSLSSLIFFIYSLFLRGVAGDDLAPVRLAAIFAFTLFVYSVPMYAAHVHDIVMYDLWKTGHGGHEACMNYLTGDGNGAQVFYYPQPSDVDAVCQTIKIHFWASGFHVLGIAALVMVCVAAFALNPGVRLISPSPIDGSEVNLEQGGVPQVHDNTGYETDLRGPYTRQISFLRDPTLARTVVPQNFPGTWSDTATMHQRLTRSSPRVRARGGRGANNNTLPVRVAETDRDCLASLPGDVARAESLDSESFSVTESCPPDHRHSR